MLNNTATIECCVALLPADDSSAQPESRAIPGWSLTGLLSSPGHVTLIVENEEISAHGCVLAARSPVFARMLLDKPDTLAIDSIPANVLRALLRCYRLCYQMLTWCL